VVRIDDRSGGARAEDVADKAAAGAAVESGFVSRAALCRPAMLMRWKSSRQRNLTSSSRSSAQVGLRQLD
jgi:hypothetical protein